MEAEQKSESSPSHENLVKADIDERETELVTRRSVRSWSALKNRKQSAKVAEIPRDVLNAAFFEWMDRLEKCIDTN
jgi:hypothetical protein